jgi:hypothetical protein
LASIPSGYNQFGIQADLPEFSLGHLGIVAKELEGLTWFLIKRVRDAPHHYVRLGAMPLVSGDVANPKLSSPRLVHQ